MNPLHSICRMKPLPTTCRMNPLHRYFGMPLSSSITNARGAVNPHGLCSIFSRKPRSNALSEPSTAACFARRSWHAHVLRTRRPPPAGWPLRPGNSSTFARVDCDSATCVAVRTTTTYTAPSAEHHFVGACFGACSLSCARRNYHRTSRSIPAALSSQRLPVWPPSSRRRSPLFAHILYHRLV